MSNDVYNQDACQIIIPNENEREICRSLLSSILSKGFEQSIIQISSIITNVIDELKSLKETKNLNEIYKENSIFLGYDIFMEYYMFKAFIITGNIIEQFNNDEKSKIIKIYRIILVAFLVIYLILFIFFLLYIFQYKDFTGCFLSFIGIIPPQFLADDDSFYKKVIELDKFYS